VSTYRLALCAAAISLGTATPAASQSIGVSSLGADTFGRDCSRDEGVQKTYCAGYILGAADQLAITGEICRPVASSGNAQTLAIVRTFLTQNPALAAKHPAWLVKEPCAGRFLAARSLKADSGTFTAVDRLRQSTMLKTGLTLALLLHAASSGASPISGLARAVDGDSLEVRGTRVRLFGIDAPELDQQCTRGEKRWDCGAEAADQLSKLVMGRTVSCAPAGLDQYERVLARCSVPGTDVNLAMVQAGYAVAYRRYSTEYVRAEEAAKAARRGVWSGTFKPPSEVRAQGRLIEAGSARSGRPAQTSASSTATRATSGCTIKGNQSRRGVWIYHLPGMPFYERTRAEAIFCSEKAAKAAGYRRAIVR